MYFFQACQFHRDQYMDHSHKLHPLDFFKKAEFMYQCPPDPTRWEIKRIVKEYKYKLRINLCQFIIFSKQDLSNNYSKNTNLLFWFLLKGQFPSSWSSRYLKNLGVIFYKCVLLLWIVVSIISQFIEFKYTSNPGDLLVCIFMNLQGRINKISDLYPHRLINREKCKYPNFRITLRYYLNQKENWNFSTICRLLLYPFRINLPVIGTLLSNSLRTSFFLTKESLSLRFPWKFCTGIYIHDQTHEMKFLMINL